LNKKGEKQVEKRQSLFKGTKKKKKKKRSLGRKRVARLLEDLSRGGTLAKGACREKRRVTRERKGPSLKARRGEKTDRGTRNKGHEPNTQPQNTKTQKKQKIKKKTKGNEEKVGG